MNMLKDIIQAVISLLVLASFMDMSYMALFTDKSAHDSATFNLVYGSVNLMAGLILNYWFGTSKSAIEKDKTIADLQSNQSKGIQP